MNRALPIANGSSEILDKEVEREREVEGAVERERDQRPSPKTKIVFITNLSF